MEIANVRKNIMGTVSFDGKFGKMRKAQDFIVYPMAEKADRAKIQSDKTCGFIDLNDGKVYLNNSRYFVGRADYLETMTAEQLFMFKAQIAATASGKAGTNGVVYCDNKGAAEVFGV